MFCRECGSEVRKKAKACPNCEAKPLSGTKHCQACGAKTKSAHEVCKECGAQLIKKGASTEEDTPIIAKVASLCMPFVGLILYMAWHTKKPESARTVCDWTIAGLAGGMILYTIGVVTGVVGEFFGF